MSTLSLMIVIVFCIGYFCIAIESLTKVNKAAVALLMFVATWTLFMFAPELYLPEAIGAGRSEWRLQLCTQHTADQVEESIAVAYRLYDVHTIGHSRQPDDIYRDDYDSA